MTQCTWAISSLSASQRKPVLGSILIGFTQLTRNRWLQRVFDCPLVIQITGMLFLHLTPLQSNPGEGLT